MDGEIGHCNWCGALIVQRSRDEEVGHRLRTVRVAHGLTQRQLGEAVYATQPTVCGWETGCYPIPPDQLRNLARVLGVPVKWLDGGGM